MVRTSSPGLEVAQDVTDDFILGPLIHFFGLVVIATCRFLSRTPQPVVPWLELLVAAFDQQGTGLLPMYHEGARTQSLLPIIPEGTVLRLSPLVGSAHCLSNLEAE